MEGWEGRIEYDTTVYSMSEKNNEGFDFENEDLRGKNLSGLKIKSIKNCLFDNTTNFSRCDLTGSDITGLTKNPDTFNANKE